MSFPRNDLLTLLSAEQRDLFRMEKAACSPKRQRLTAGQTLGMVDKTRRSQADDTVTKPLHFGAKKPPITERPLQVYEKRVWLPLWSYRLNSVEAESPKISVTWWCDNCCT